jgi:hypothetical protein
MGQQNESGDKFAVMIGHNRRSQSGDGHGIGVHSHLWFGNGNNWCVTELR